MTADAVPTVSAPPRLEAVTGTTLLGAGAGAGSQLDVASSGAGSALGAVIVTSADVLSVRPSKETYPVTVNRPGFTYTCAEGKELNDVRSVGLS